MRGAAGPLPDLRTVRAASPGPAAFNSVTCSGGTRAQRPELGRTTPAPHDLPTTPPPQHQMPLPALPGRYWGGAHRPAPNVPHLPGHRMLQDTRAHAGKIYGVHDGCPLRPPAAMSARDPPRSTWGLGGSRAPGWVTPWPRPQAASQLLDLLSAQAQIQIASEPRPSPQNASRPYYRKTCGHLFSHLVCRCMSHSANGATALAAGGA